MISSRVNAPDRTTVNARFGWPSMRKGFLNMSTWHTSTFQDDLRSRLTSQRPHAVALLCHKGSVGISSILSFHLLCTTKVLIGGWRVFSRDSVRSLHPASCWQPRGTTRKVRMVATLSHLLHALTCSRFLHFAIEEHLPRTPSRMFDRTQRQLVELLVRIQGEQMLQRQEFPQQGTSGSIGENPQQSWTLSVGIRPEIILPMLDG